MTFAQQLAEIEKAHCATGKLPEVASPDMLLYVLQVHNCDARKSHGVALSESVNPLLKLRAYMERGQLVEARILLQELKTQFTQTDEQTELLLEEARLANNDGNWAETIRCATLALNLRPSAVTMLTLLQVRALGHFEQGDMSAAQKDLENAEALYSILPKSSAGFYAQVLRARIQVRTQSLACGRELLKSLWKTKDLNADLILVLLRAEIDLKRFQGESCAALCFSSYTVSQSLGDLLYTALAFIDTYYALPTEKRLPLHSRLNDLRKNFVRINQLCNEVEGLSVASTTAQGILHASPAHNGDCIDFSSRSDFLFLHESSRLVDLSKDGSFEVEKGKIHDSLSILSKTPSISKSDFFSQLWGKQKYASYLHDNLIWNLLSRLRNDYRIDITVEKKIVETKSKILVART